MSNAPIYMFYHRHFSEAFYSRVYFSAFQPSLKIKKCVQTEECTHEKHKLRFATTQKTHSRLPIDSRNAKKEVCIFTKSKNAHFYL